MAVAPQALACTSLFWPLINAGRYQSLVASPPPLSLGVCRNTLNAPQVQAGQVSWRLECVTVG